MNTTITSTDMFCGAGGSATGAEAAGVESIYAMNHWQTAVDTFSTNHPRTQTDCVDIRNTHPGRYKRTSILIASPECFPASTLILTDRGMKPIADIAIGDMVLTHTGRYCPVIHTQTSVTDTIIVKGQGHSTGLEVTPNHPFYLRQQTPIWNNKKCDYDRHVFTEPNWSTIDPAYTTRWATPAIFPPLPIPPIGPDRTIAFTPEFWWFVGYWLGNGSLRKDRPEIIISCGKRAAEKIAKRLNFAPRTNKRAKSDELVWWRHEVRTATNFICSFTALHSWLNTNFGNGAYHKSLPAWVLGMPETDRAELLAGYIAADGHTTKRATQTSTVSKPLAIGIRLLATSLGYHTGLGKTEYEPGQIEERPIPAYTLWVVRFENNKSQRTGIFDDLHGWTLVKSIAPGNNNVPVYNFEVAEDQSYIADGIVVHNCTNHSLAKGVRRRTAQAGLFGDPAIDPAAERSRATMWDVPVFAEHHRYDVVIIENVVDARHWLPYEAWLNAMTLLGYEHQELYINSMHRHPTPQSRDRMYVVFWRKEMRRPDLEFTAIAWCAKCERDVEARQSWKKRKRWGRYGPQYVYACPTCHTKVEPYYYAAANAIDWDLPVERIGDRKRPLVQKTRDRIEAGLRRYGIIPQTVTNTSPGWTHPITEAAPTMVASASLHALLLPTTHTDLRSASPTDPLPTQTSRQEMALVVHQRNNSAARSITDALSTMTAGGIQHELVIPYYSTGVASHIDEALPTVTTTNRFGLLDPKPFILGYYTRLSGEQVAISDILDAWPTLATQPRHALIYPDINAIIDDCGFRMFEPHEIQAAMALPVWYKLLGTKRDQIRLAGNAVTPPVMEWICSRVKEIL